MNFGMYFSVIIGLGILASLTFEINNGISKAQEFQALISLIILYYVAKIEDLSEKSTEDGE